MKKLLILALCLFSVNAFAVSKCNINGVWRVSSEEFTGRFVFKYDSTYVQEKLSVHDGLVVYEPYKSGVFVKFSGCHVSLQEGGRDHDEDKKDLISFANFESGPSGFNTPNVGVSRKLTMFRLLPR